MISIINYSHILKSAYNADRIGKKRQRSTNLIRDSDITTPKSLFAYLPSCFNNALDIAQSSLVRNQKKTLVWTQGALFNFCPGYTIFNAPNGYELWSDAVKNITYCLSVKTASPVDYSLSEGKQNRNPGRVVFSILTANPKKTGLQEVGQFDLTQDAFVLFLIAGPRPTLLEASPYELEAMESLIKQADRIDSLLSPQ